MQRKFAGFGAPVWVGEGHHLQRQGNQNTQREGNALSAEILEMICK